MTERYGEMSVDIAAASTAPAPPFARRDLRRAWQACWDAWLEDSAGSPRTRRAYTRAWEDLLAFCGDPPEALVPAQEFWEITHRYIRAWMEDLATRPLDPRRVKTLQKQGRKRTCGYAKSTINQYLAAISSFYRYAECHGTVRLPDGREVELTRLSGIRLNPVDLIEQRGAAGAPQRERVYLSLEQLRHFLSAIPRHTTLGLRDRALLLFYVMTGGRNSEVRTLRWGDLRERGGRIFWRQRGRGKEPEAWKALPPECWEALQHYLKAARRWDDLQEGDYLFTALTERAAHLPTVSEGRWEPHAHPLSINEVTRIVKRYAKRAGLDPKEVHVRSLRHSAAMLMDEVGADPEEIRDFLNHENLDTTRRYLHEMRGQRNVHAAKMAEALRL